MSAPPNHPLPKERHGRRWAVRTKTTILAQLPLVAALRKGIMNTDNSSRNPHPWEIRPEG